MSYRFEGRYVVADNEGNILIENALDDALTPDQARAAADELTRAADLVDSSRRMHTA